jgi:hypothetical protein
MRKTLLLLLLLLSATWLLAQDNMGKSSDASGPTIEGCLSVAGGHYILTDSSGQGYRLSGYANKLKAHVGHDIKITGMPGDKTVSTTEQGVGSTVKTIPVFHVKSIEHVADSCKAK